MGSILWDSLVPVIDFILYLVLFLMGVGVLYIGIIWRWTDILKWNNVNQPPEYPRKSALTLQDKMYAALLAFVSMVVITLIALKDIFP